VRSARWANDPARVVFSSSYNTSAMSTEKNAPAHDQSRADDVPAAGQETVCETNGGEQSATVESPLMAKVRAVAESARRVSDER
jgi:hypothetical protein